MEAGSSRQDQPAADPLVGEIIDGKYHVLDLVGRGGMAKVYRAEQLPLGRSVALKVLSPPDAVDLEAFQKRFFREAELGARLSHANCVGIIDFGITRENLYFIAMEFAEGQTLSQIIRRSGAMNPQRVLNIALQICNALQEAHSFNLIHRDLKPGNVVVTHDEDEGDLVKVLDFGLVKALDGDDDITQDNQMVGSPMYMSPEQIQGNDLDGRTDIYALGTLMYRCLTAESPFASGTSMNVLFAKLQSDPIPLAETRTDDAISSALDWAVMTCMARDRRNRFVHVRELIYALRAIELEYSGALFEPLQLSLKDGHTVLPATMPDLSSGYWREASMLTTREISGPVTAQGVPPEGEAARWRGLAGVLAVCLLLVSLGVVLMMGVFSSSWSLGPSGVATPNASAVPPTEAVEVADPSPDPVPPEAPINPEASTASEAPVPVEEAPPQPAEAPSPATPVPPTTARPAPPSSTETKPAAAPKDADPVTDESKGYIEKKGIRNPWE